MIIIHLIEEAGLTRHVPVKAVIRCKLNCIGIKFNKTHVQFFSHVQYTSPHTQMNIDLMHLYNNDTFRINSHC